MNKKQFDNLTKEIEEMLEAYYHNAPFNGYFGISKGHPYSSKLYCTGASGNRRKGWYFDLQEKGIWIVEIKNKLLEWSRCEYSYTFSGKSNIIHDFMFQNSSNYCSEDDGMLALEEYMQYHKQLLKEFFCDFVLVYLKNFNKNNPSGLYDLYCHYCKDIAKIGLLLNKYDLPWISLKRMKIHFHEHIPSKMVNEFYNNELSEYPLFI